MSRERNKLQKVVNSRDIKEPAPPVKMLSLAALIANSSGIQIRTGT
jgi:hypothetical protein